MRQRTISLLLMAVFVSTTLCAQTISIETQDSLGFTQISDSIIKRELSFFTVKGSSFIKTDTLYKKQLTEIPVRNCTDKEVNLWWSTSKISTFIHIYFKAENPNRILDSIFLVTHSHFWVKFPKSAFQGLPQNNSCSFNGVGKTAEFYSPYYKAFYSTDKRRLYIYMQGGTDSNKYEVTWIIVNDKYYTRIVDSIL